MSLISTTSMPDLIWGRWGPWALIPHINIGDSFPFTNSSWVKDWLWLWCSICFHTYSSTPPPPQETFLCSSGHSRLCLAQYWKNWQYLRRIFRGLHNRNYLVSFPSLYFLSCRRRREGSVEVDAFDIDSSSSEDKFTIQHCPVVNFCGKFADRGRL